MTMYFAWRMLVEAERIDKRNAQFKLRVQLHLNNALEFYSETKFIKLYGLTKGAFNFLCDILSEHSTLRSTLVPLEAKVLSALLYYTNGDFQRIGGKALFSRAKTMRYIKEVTEAINTKIIVDQFVKFPITKQERDIIQQRFLLKHGIPGVIGCMDTTHFRISTPPKGEKYLFYNPEDYHSLNVQMICDDNYKILAVNPRFGGATADSFIWKNSCINNYLQSVHSSGETVCLLGNSRYPLSPWLLTPYTETVPGSIEDNFNAKHSKAYVTIDNTFGRLRKNWKCLSKDSILRNQPVMCAKIITACCVLHNLALDFNVPKPDDEIYVHQDTQQSENKVNDTDLIRARVLRDQVASKLIRE